MEVEEGVLTMEENQGSHYHFLAHFQPCPYHLALVKAEDITPGLTLCKPGEGLAQRQRTRSVFQRSCPNMAYPLPFVSVLELYYRCRPDSSSPAQTQFCWGFQRAGAPSRMPGVRGSVALY